MCDELCDTLIVDCRYAAYPDRSSCIDGCLLDIDAGAEIHTLEACVLDAECDTSAVLQCARAYGGEP